MSGETRLADFLPPARPRPVSRASSQLSRDLARGLLPCCQGRSAGGTALLPAVYKYHSLPSVSAVQFLGSVLFDPLSAAKEQGQAACGLGIGISLRQFSRPWSGELPGGYPVVKHEQSWTGSQCSVNPWSPSLLP